MDGAARSPPGREAELRAIEAFLARRTLASLVLAGSAGVGKTTLWEAAVERAAAAGLRVLQTRARDSEAALAFTGLGDLLADVDDGQLAALPPPQRHAVEVALLRAEPTAGGAEPRAIAVGVLGVLRQLVAAGPLVVAIDDVQWLDGPTADALGFALRRLEGQPLLVVASEREATGTAFDPPGDVERLTVGGLGAEALAAVLAERLGLRLHAGTARELERASHGNPMFAIEVGRRLQRDGIPPVGQPLPHPGGIEELVRSRVVELPEPVRQVLLTTALGDVGPGADAAALVAEDPLHAAISQGLVVAGERLRPAHPLLGAAAVAAASPAERRAVHGRLALHAATPEARAHHHALAVSGADAEAAAELAAAAARLAGRGALGDATRLAGHALRLTPADDPQRVARVLELGDLLARAGYATRLDELLDAEFDGLPPGAARARGHLLRLDGLDAETMVAYEGHIERALAEEIGDPTVWAQALARRVVAVALVAVERLALADEWSAEALRVAETADEPVAREAIASRAWVLALRGRPLDEPALRSRGLPDADLYHSLDRIEARRRTWRGELDAGRALLSELHERADARGEDLAVAISRFHRLELELRAGRAADAARWLEQAEDLNADGFLAPALLERLHAQLAIVRGDLLHARRSAARAIELSTADGLRWHVLEAAVAAGVAALASGDPEAALEPLESVWAHLLRERIDELGAFPVAPELAEALVALGRLDDAHAVGERVGVLAAEGHPWAAATADRIAGLVQAAEGGAAQERGWAALARAAEAYGEQGLGHDAGRTLLALGRSQRRQRKWGGARTALEGARAAFAGDGATGWAALADDELARVGGRRPRREETELTPAEARVATLAVEGRTNKEIAQVLVVTVSTVEAHLSRIYAKLGIRSRNQLASRLPDDALADQEA
ncbi:helix-turn-helix transcriptional regulator [Patulibacter defluvii]|uniref:helix-turn-helix transcriptional regulator n=1 Tax=Patulibacter defluvii TaxID=3095358 RepID=UPI002A74EB47|nr:LuxR family transcriptional regulator [Patulibacter sp. DM4]